MPSMHLYPKLSSSLPITPVFAPISFLCAARSECNKLGPEGAAALAPAIAVCASLTSLDISNTKLTGDYPWNEMSGVIAIAEALKGNASLTSVR